MPPKFLNSCITYHKAFLKTPNDYISYLLSHLVSVDQLSQFSPQKHLLKVHLILSQILLDRRFLNKELSIYKRVYFRYKLPDTRTSIISFLYVCMANTIQFSLVETPRKFTIAIINLRGVSKR